MPTLQNTADTKAAKNGFADEIVQQIDTNQPLTIRLLSATQAGGVAEIEDWEKTKNTHKS
jgi:hypothetical protein